MSFDRYIQLCRHVHHQDIEHFQHPRGSLVPLLSLFLPSGNTDMFFVPTALSFLESHFNRSQQYIDFHVWFCTFSKNFFTGFCYDVACISFLSIDELFHDMNVPQFVYPDRHLAYLQFWSIINKSPRNIHI